MADAGRTPPVLCIDGSDKHLKMHELTTSVYSLSPSKCADPAAFVTMGFVTTITFELADACALDTATPAHVVQLPGGAR